MSQKKMYKCHICDDHSVYVMSEYSQLKRVASDCRPWKSGGELGICCSCSIVQKIINKTWKEEVSEIYSSYNLYHQSDNGDEQLVFNQYTGESQPRSQKILNEVLRFIDSSCIGNALDVGCGNGAMLKSMLEKLPSWNIYGFEPNYNDVLKKIKNIKAVFKTNIEEISIQFDLISVIHALEHIENPIRFLFSLKDRMKDNSILLIQVPYFVDNYFDLLIADHCTHFTISSLNSILEYSGFEVLFYTTKLIDKELTVVAKLKDRFTQIIGKKSIEIREDAYSIQAILSGGISWIKNVLKVARNISIRGNFGIFGTSIAANWIIGELLGSVDFFVEEDVNRIDKSYRGLPVLHPLKVPKNSNIYLLLPYMISIKIYQRLNGLNNANYYVTPSI